MKTLSQDELDRKDDLVVKASKVLNGISVKNFKDSQGKLDDVISYCKMAKRVGQTSKKKEQKFKF